VTSATLTLGKRSYPVIWPNTRDPRLHVAAVIVTIHVLGQVGLRFQVSVPQILSAIVTCAVLEIGLTFRARKVFVWPASAMLTGSGVALILRVPGTPPGDHWTTYKWYVFAGVAAFSLLTKYAIRYRGSPVFNPSNIGLVVAFLLLGSTRVEPLDFWWAPWARWMILAYAVILVGGLLITARLDLLAAVVMFWTALAAGIGVLAASGHCMTARWAFAPVCGFDYWRVIVTSPEVLIFLFFMLTDPKTVPTGRVGRVVFALLVAVTSTLLMATQSQEFGTKVALLGGLVLVCAARPLVDRLVPEPRSTADDLRRVASRLAIPGGPGGRVVGSALRLSLIAAVLLGLGAAIAAAGSPARGVVVPAAADVLNRVPHDVNPATLPDISVDQDVLDWNHEISGDGAQEIVLTLVENLELENRALRRPDESILTAVDHGDRLDEMRGRLNAAVSSGTTTVEHYRIDDVHVTLLVPFGRQDGLSLGLESRGTKTRETYDAAGHLRSRISSPFATTFVVRRATGARWLNVAQLPPGVDR
jgi:Na+-translocating ferredoxin:NAD+ oxidoreductase RnfD subunit